MMYKKNYFFFLLCFFFFTNAKGQITKGNWLIGGSGSFSKDKTKFPSGEISSTQINLNPRIGCFIATRFALGLYGNYSKSAEKSFNIKISSNYFGIGPFARYYFLTEESKVNLLLEGYGTYNEEGNSNIPDRSAHIAYGISAGSVIFLNSSVGLELLLGYKGYNISNSDITSKGLAFNIGIQYHLEKE